MFSGVLVAASVAVALFSSGPAIADDAPAPLPICSYGQPSAGCIVDGDTVWLGGHKIRLEDIDAPEIERVDCPAELELGTRAKLRLQQLLNGAPYTVAQEGSREHDVYHRELRTIRIGGVSVGATLVAEGLAHWWVGHKLPWCN